MHFIKARIRELRPKGKTQTGLGQVLGLDPARITEIMKGERQVKASELVPMSDYLEMPLTDVIAALEAAQADEDPVEAEGEDGPELRFGAHVRGLREAKGMSVPDLARATRVSPAVISRIEAADWKPKDEILLNIAKVLGVDGPGLIARAAQVPPELGNLIRSHEAQGGLAELLRTTRDFSPEQMKELIERAKRAKTKP